MAPADRPPPARQAVGDAPAPGRGASSPRRWLRLRWRAVLPLLIGLTAIVSLVLLVNPSLFASTIRRFNLWLIAPIVVGSLAYYVLQGVRWHFLLRDVGVRLRLRDTVLLNIAGQAATLLPLGELTRAVLVSDAAHADLPDVVATVTVQELIYSLLLIVIALPGLVAFHVAALVVAVALGAALGVLAVLTISPLFRLVHGLMMRLPLVNRLGTPVGTLQREALQLLHRPNTLGWSLLSVAGAGSIITVFWLVVQALDPGALSWPEVASIYAVASIAGAISLIPGGIGASEAAVIGLLVASGLSPSTAAAVALVQRCADKGLATLAGFGAFAVARRRFHLRGLRSLRPPGSGGPPVGGRRADPGPVPGLTS